MKVLLMSVVFSAAGIIAPVAAQAIAQSYQLNIPQQPLDAALKDLAQQTGLQIGRLPDRQANAPLVGPVNGEMSVEKALHTLLSPTQFTYKVVNDSTIAVLAANSIPSAPSTFATQRDDPSNSGQNNDQKEGKKDSSRDFRVAQVDQAKPSNTLPITSVSSAQSSNAPLEEIVVTAQKRQERLQDVPISISVLSGAQLDKSTFSGATEALNTVPGVAAFPVQVQTGGTMLSIRGVSAAGPQGAGASTVGYYIDSVPFGQIRNSLVPDPNVYDLSQIEVLRGPQGTLYGADALVGVIRVMTNDPDLNNFDFKMSGVQSTTEYGGGNYNGNAAVNLPLIDGVLGIRATVGDEHESGWINGPLGTHLNSGDLRNARIKLTARPTDDLSLVLSAWHSQQRFASPAESDGNRDVSTIRPQPMDTEFDAYGARFAYDPAAFTLTSMTSYITYSNNNIFDLSGAGDPAQTFFTALPSRVFAEEINLTSKSDGPWRWSAGTMYRDARDTTDQYYINYPEPTTTTVSDNFHDTSRSIAVYGELGRFLFDRKIEISAGLRYFHDDEATQAIGTIPGFDVPLNKISATSSATTPRAVLTWFPRSDLTAYATYSQGFRSGIPQDELVGTVVQGFPALKPDKLSNYELGIKGSMLNGLFVYDAAVYFMDWKDIQQQLNVPIPGGPPGADVFVLVNANTVRGEGTEFSLKAKPIDGLTLAANFSWNNLHFTSNVISGDAVLFTEGSRPNESPEYTAGLAVDYSFPLVPGKINGVLSLSGNYISDLNISYLNGSNLSDLAGNSSVLSRGSFTVQFPKHWDVALFVDNANNWNGTQSVAQGLPQYDARLRPRTYGIRFDYHLL